MAGILGMAFTGKQPGERKLHWVYRLMLVCIAVTILAGFVYSRFFE